MANVAGARERAEFDRLIAERENQQKQREADEMRCHAKHCRDMAILAGNKEEAVARAKLKAIKGSI